LVVSIGIGIEEKRDGWEHTEVLVHGVGVVGPGLKVVLKGSELLLEALDVGGVLVEEDLESIVSILFTCLRARRGHTVP